MEWKKSAISHISYRGQRGFSFVSSKLAQGLLEDINQTAFAEHGVRLGKESEKILKRYDWRNDGNFKTIFSTFSLAKRSFQFYMLLKREIRKINF